MKQPLIGGWGVNPLNFDETRYTLLQGGDNYTNVKESVYECIPTGGKISRLFVNLNAAIAAGSTVTFTLMVNGIAQALTCTIAAGTSSAYDIDHSVDVVAGDLVCLRYTFTGTPGTVYARWATQFEGTNAGESILLWCGTLDSGATVFGGWCGTRSRDIAGQMFPPVPTNGTFKKMYASLSADPGASPDAYKFDLLIDAIAGNNTFSIVANNTTGNSGAATDVVTAGQKITLSVTPVSTPSVSPYCAMGIVFVSSIDGESIHFLNDTDSPSTSVEQYDMLLGLDTYWGSTESNKARMSLLTCVIKKLYVKMQTSPGAGKKYTVSINKNDGSASGLTVEVADTNTSGNDTIHSYIPVDGDTATFKCVPSGTPTVTRIGCGFVAYNPTSVYAPMPSVIPGMALMN